MRRLEKNEKQYSPYVLLIIFIGLYINLPFQIVFYILAAIVWYFIAQDAKGSKEISSKWVSILVGTLLLIATSPYLFSHSAPFGYDTGIYRHEFEFLFNLIPEFNFAIHPGLFLLTDFLHILGVQVETLMREGYIFLYLLLGLSIYSTTKEFSTKQAGILAFAIFILSSVQFTAYTYMLYKNILGLSILLFSLILIKRRSHLLLPTGLFLAILQPTHFVLFGLTLFSLWIWNWKEKDDRRYFFIHGSIILGLALSILTLKPHLITTAWDIIQKKDALSSGVFLTTSTALKAMILYLPIGILGLLSWSDKKRKPLLTITITTALIVFLRGFFFQRYIIELDVFIIIYAGIGLSMIFGKIMANSFYKNIFITFVSLAFLSHIISIMQYKPWISEGELSEIQALCETTEPNVYVMATHSYYSPWIHGYSCRDAYAPGLFAINKWNYPTWRTFWNGNKKQREELMQETFGSEERPVYIFIGEKQPQMNFSEHQGFTRLSDKLWKWE